MSKQAIQSIDVQANWCSPFRPSKYNGKYMFDAVHLTEEQQKVFRELGINVNYDQKRDPKDPDFKGFFVKFKSDSPVQTTDMQGKPFPPSILIGNGSIVRAYFTPKDWVHKDSGRAGVRAQWLGAKIKELVKYDPDAAAKAEAASAMEADDDESGFVLTESMAAEADTTSEAVAVDNKEFDELFDATE